MSIVFGDDPIRQAVSDILSRIEKGQAIDDAVERQYVDLKEEHGRRDRSGKLAVSQPHNEAAARELTAAAACMANTSGGGALIVGVSDEGELIGTDLDVEWLRHRIWELSSSEVFQALDATTPTVHRQQGLVIGQERQIPRRAAREAVVNGVAHREWGISEPTVVEFVGQQLRVTSPGGFVGGVTPDNIITHPSRSRNKALAELLAALRVAEREGIGVDRMTRDMIRVGHSAPEIVEIPGPYVRATLIGGDIDEAWMAWLQAISPASIVEDLNFLLIIRSLLLKGWMDPVTAARVIQDSVTTARSALSAASKASFDGSPLLTSIDGVPDDQEPVWRLSHDALEALHAKDGAAGPPRARPSRESVASSYAAHRGRISSTELGSLVGMAPNNVGPVLKELEQEGVLRPAWPSRRGRGFHYLYASQLPEVLSDQE